MAKKKKATKKKKTRRQAAKKPKPAKKRNAVKKKTTAKKKSSARSRKTAGSSKSTSRGTSVDTLLAKFEKERRAKESILDTSRKQIEDLQAKVAKLEDQIAKLKTKSSETQSDIDQLDSRRDTEVSELLVKLGVHLRGSGVANTSSPPRPALTLGSATVELDKKNS